jgi:excisionase family DNA binding protein
MSAVQLNPQAQAADSERLSTPKLGWTLNELARSLSVSVPFIRLEVKRGRLKAAHLGRRVVVLDTEVRRYLAEASVGECSRR